MNKLAILVITILALATLGTARSSAAPSKLPSCQAWTWNGIHIFPTELQCIDAAPPNMVCVLTASPCY